MDPEFFEQLAMPLFDSLYNLAHWLTGDRVDAEDLVQETYAKALKGFKSFQEGTNLRAWMFRILRNTFLTSRSGLAARSTSSLEDEEEEAGALAAHSITPESLLLRSEDRQRVLDALAELPVHYREILLLCEVEELSYREIADVLSLPIGTVMSRLSRARNSLRRLVEMPSMRSQHESV
ncbi:sigma-70 family RNA polymerase sigma factor [Alloacidobacterium sp.]|uniref:sigma-70 family RNA polymerase sigma factor n=1 Tax=Alloacidobacterium sp. TaxID=2951999 RepID=UPI002D33385C|nr:sigma-70 family RNA polymerase sigma factor [Alloacidobacterium sp.]HYK35532.1 sigma-70 family RNA polymerase sigma factor [Alloacidobacterium sp.]